MCVFLVCVLVLFRASACVFRVSELLVVRLSFAVKLFRVCCVAREIPKSSCRVLNASFSFEFVVEIFVSYFEVEFWIRFLEFSKSCFEVVFRIRLFRFVALFDFSNFNFRFEFSIQVPWIWWFEIVVEIFVSLLYSTSRISLWIRRRIRLLEFRCSIRLLEFRFLDSSVEFKSLEFVVEFQIRLSCRLDLFDFSNFDDRQVLELLFSKSHSSFEFLIELFNFRLSSIKKPNFCAKLRADVAHYSRTIALASLSLPRELCARFSCVKY